MKRGSCGEDGGHAVRLCCGGPAVWRWGEGYMRLGSAWGGSHAIRWHSVVLMRMVRGWDDYAEDKEVMVSRRRRGLGVGVFIQERRFCEGVVEPMRALGEGA